MNMKKNRSPNQSRQWYCVRCEQHTDHIVSPKYLGGWCEVREGIWAYTRYHECEDCEIPREWLEREMTVCTIQLEKSAFDNVCDELDSLREFKNAVEQALTKTGKGQ